MIPYPVMLNLANKQVAVIGGGKVAARKVRKLLEVNAQVTVISPTLNADIESSRITWLAEPYRRQLVTDMDLMIVCTDNMAVNQQVKNEASHFQWVNDATDKQHTDFYNVATAQVEDVMITVSTGGKSPSRAKRIRQQIQEWLIAQTQK